MLTQRRDTKAIKAQHVNQVHEAKRLIEQAAFEILSRQFRDAAAELLESGVAKQSVIFRPRDWHQRVRGAIGPSIARVMLIGAVSELIRHKRITPQKSTASDYLAKLGIDFIGGIVGFATELGQELIDGIQATLFDSFKRPYWDHISGTTANQIEGVLANGIIEGHSIRDMARELVDTGEVLSRQRAVVIAQTESSRALNSGHLDGMAFIEEDTGLEFGKEWISVQGATTRPTHAALDGVVVPTDGTFSVGGYPAKYPSDPDLPPHEAINCLCTIISSIAE